MRQTDVHMGREAMGKWIDADALKIPSEEMIAKMIIDSAPSIDIVRCKECKHYDKFPTWSACTYWSGDPYEQASVNADDFCSYGEREGE